MRPERYLEAVTLCKGVIWAGAVVEGWLTCVCVALMHHWVQRRDDWVPILRSSLVLLLPCKDACVGAAESGRNSTNEMINNVIVK